MRGVYDGTYQPGQKLTEAELTERFSVGRGTVREALKRLATEGVVTINLHRGASIRVLSREESLDMLLVGEALFSLAVRLAAERWESPEEVKTLLDALNTLTAAIADPNSVNLGSLRTTVYRELAQMSRNEDLSRSMIALQPHLTRIQFGPMVGAEIVRSRARDYRRIIEAILAKDGPRAERAMRQHVRHIMQQIQTTQDGAFAP